MGRTPLRVRDEADAARLVEASRRRPVLLFKHSRTCSISAAALHEWEEFARGPAAEGVVLAFLVVQDDRPGSDAVARLLGVRHESPQAILISGGRALWHASHWGITAEALARAVAAARRGGEPDAGSG